jgi:hypothetical protein|tara:strand:- start:2936 stop:3181 length:246 start_codon:yes stop_codon:yes gene_type:complete
MSIQGLMQFTEQEMMDTPPEALVNVTDSPEVRVFLSNLPQEMLVQIEQMRQQAEATGQMEQFNQMLMQLMQESNPMQQGIM